MTLCIRKDLEGRGFHVIHALSHNFLGETEDNDEELQWLGR
jgi:hypothetical protein